MRDLWPKTAILGLLTLSSTGCFFFGNGGGSDPCDDDRFGCDMGEFVDDPSCELDGELMVRVGAGETGFEPLEDGEAPPIINGAQGGQHTMLGVEVNGAAIDDVPMLEVVIGIYPASACTAEGEPCEGAPTLGERVVVLGDIAPLEVTDDGVVREHGIVVFLGWADEAEAVLQVEVQDPCGQYGMVQHRMPTDDIGL